MSRFLTVSDEVLDRLASLYEAVCVILLIAMLAINAANIVSRGLFDHVLNWVWPWTMVAFLYWVMLAFYPLYRRRKDVSIYIVLRFLSPPLRRLLGIIVHAMIAIGIGILLYTIPERMGSMRGSIEIVGLPRVILIYPLILSTVPIVIDTLISLAAIIAGRRDYSPFGVIEVLE